MSKMTEEQRVKIVMMVSAVLIVVGFGGFIILSVLY